MTAMRAVGTLPKRTRPGVLLDLGATSEGGTGGVPESWPAAIVAGLVAVLAAGGWAVALILWRWR